MAKINQQIKSGKYDKNSNSIYIKVKDTSYKLLSTVFHKGPLPTQGHYLSIINHNGQYYQMNDHDVQKVNEISNTSSIIKSGDSYILLYQKC